MHLTWIQALAVAVGGALGSLARWRVGLWLNVTASLLPWGTLLVNCVGGLFIGIALVALARPGAELARLLLVVGFLGGFTTFSAFSAESLSLLLRGHGGWAALHTLLHVAGALGCAALGHALATRLGLAAS